ncbi:MAG: peptidoglycan-binding protein [Christensenellales bacterium]
MATLFVFDKTQNSFSAVSPSPLRSGDDIAWTDAAFIAACKELCGRFELKLSRSFRPVRPGCMDGFSAHHAGLAGDFTLLSPCKNLAARQNEIRRWCVNSGLFSCVQPQYRTPLWVHAEVSVTPPASLLVPYPALFPGNMGVHVFILQRCLNIAGFPCLLCGGFNADTEAALRDFRRAVGLSPENIIDAQCWLKLMEQVRSAAKQS